MIQKQLKKIRDCCSSQGLKKYEIYIESSRGLQYEVQNRRLESQEMDESMGFGIRVLQGKKLGFSFGTDLSKRAIETVIDMAQHNASYGLSDSLYGFVHKQTMPQVDTWDDSLQNLSFQEKKEKAFELEKVALDFDKRVKMVQGATYNESLEEMALWNTEGVDLFQRQTRVDMYLMALAESHGESEAGADFQSSPFLADLSAQKLGMQAARLAVEQLGGKPIPNFNGPVILHANVNYELLELLSESVLAENVFKRNSYLTGKLGKKVYSSAVNFIDDGLYPHGVMTKAFDSEGTPQQTTTVMQRGVLKSYLYDLYWSKKFQAQSTGNSERQGPLEEPSMGVSNFYLKPGDVTFEGLLNEMGSGVLVTELIGMHMTDPVSGDFSVGMRGCLVKNGKVGQAVKQVTLSGNLHQLFADIVMVADDLKFHGSCGAPSILVSHLSISGE